MNIFRPEVNESDYIIATYDLGCQGTLSEGAYALAVGQSIGNPNVRSNWETDEIIDRHSCMILHEKNALDREGITENAAEGIVRIAFPIVNINLLEDGISHLLCQLMGGQMDIDFITKCRLVDIQFPDSINSYCTPKYGIDGIRDYVGRFQVPLLGGIVKPKMGLTPTELLDMVKQMVDGGVDFIKEDEIMSNPSICPINQRVPLVSNWLVTHAPNVIYAVSITSDYPYIFNRVNEVYNLGASAIHVNIWNGLGVYKAIREMDLPLFLFFQKSGDKVITDSSHRFGIDWKVICKLAAWSGVDFIHAGMWGGYMHNTESELKNVLDVLRTNNVMPSLSCGMNPIVVNQITELFGTEYMATVGGAIHGHPMGSRAGSAAMRQAIDKTFGQEYKHWVETQ